MLEKIFGEKCCRGVLEKSVVEKWWRRVGLRVSARRSVAHRSVG